MAIEKPTLFYPSDVENVDPHQIIKATWRASSPQTDYKFDVYRQSDNSNIYSSGKINSKNLYHDIPANTLNSHTNEDLYATVTVYNNLDSATSSFEYFKANVLPTITIVSYPSPIPTEKHTFSFTYAQANNINYKAWKFKLYDDQSNLLSDTGFLYSSDTDIYTQEYEATNLGRGKSFKIEFVVLTEVEQEATSGLQDITIEDYHIFPETPEFTATPDDTNGSIVLSFKKYQVIQATASGTTSFVSGKFNQAIEISTGNVTIPEPIPQDFSLVWYFKMPHDFNGKMLELQDDANTIELGYENNKFYYKDTDGTKHETDTIIPYTMADFQNSTLSAYKSLKLGDFDSNYMGNWAFVILTNNKLYIKLDTQLKTLVVDWDIDLKSTSTHANTKFYGKTIIDQVHAYKKVFTQDEIENFDINTITSWDVDTEYLAKFDGNMEAGNVAGGEGFQGYRFKRQEVGSAKTVTIAELIDKSNTSRKFIDKNTKNKTPYIYSLAIVNDNGEGTYQLSQEVQNNFFGSFLISEDSQVSYHFDAGFGGGLSLSPIVKNFDHHIYENYDRTPIVSTSIRSYSTSGLTAFIYKKDAYGQYDYTLSRKEVDSLEDFITNGSKKIYKDYLGNVFVVSTFDFSKALASDIGLDLYSSVSFQWVEVGDVDG